ncbi:MAG: hypothetical protein HPY96_00710 [Bacilli bacterium]|nr:hypothetical protein [Bacilli bacterium]
MSYKKIFDELGIQQKDLLAELNRNDRKMDKSLLSKIVNHLVLPTKQQLKTICAFLNCHVLDLYSTNEIDLISVSRNVKIEKKKKSKSNKYNLHVEIDRTVAEKVLSKESLKILGIENLSDYIRDCIDALSLKLQRIKDQNEKTSSEEEV